MDRSDYKPETLQTLEHILGGVIDFNREDLKQWAIKIDKNPVNKYLEEVKRDSLREGLVGLGFPYSKSTYFDKSTDHELFNIFRDRGVWACDPNVEAEGLHLVNLEDFLKLVHLLLAKQTIDALGYGFPITSLYGRNLNTDSTEVTKGKTTLEVVLNYFKTKDKR